MPEHVAELVNKFETLTGVHLLYPPISADRFRRIDPDPLRRFGRLRQPMYEPLRISGVGRAEDCAPLREHGSGFAEMHYSRREQRQATALYTNFQKGRCLTHVGTEGGTRVMTS